MALYDVQDTEKFLSMRGKICVQCGEDFIRGERGRHNGIGRFVYLQLIAEGSEQVYGCPSYNIHHRCFPDLMQSDKCISIEKSTTITIEGRRITHIICM